MKKLILLFLLLPFFSFRETTTESDVFLGDSIVLGNELYPNQSTERWTSKYSQALNIDEYNLGASGATMTPNTGRPTFNLNDVPFYNSTEKNIFISYWGNDYSMSIAPYSMAITPATFAAATSNAVDGIMAKGWPAAKIVLCFNYLPESPGSWINMTDSVAQQWLSALRSVQQAKHTSFLDFYTAIYNRPDKATYSNDLVHPTAAWNTIMKDLAITNIELPSSTLPATLISFSGQHRSGANELNWTVAQEQNVQTYAVERSENGTAWSSVGNVNSLGSTTAQRSYSFIDNNVSGVKQLYRLRIIEKSGQSKFSSIVVITGSKPTALMLSGLFPNPASNKITLVVDAPSKDNIIIQVIDVAGRVISAQKQLLETGSNTIDLHIQAINSGTYFTKIISETNNMVVTGKFVKE